MHLRVGLFLAGVVMGRRGISIVPLLTLAAFLLAVVVLGLLVQD
jgi:hypothetical protein